MDAVALIKEHLDVEKILHHYQFNSVEARGNYCRSCCGIHHGDNPSGFVINIEEGLWTCHTGPCGSGDIFHLVQQLENCTFPESVHKLAELLGIDIQNLTIVARNKQEQKELKQFLEALQRFQEKSFENYQPEGTQKRIKRFKDFSKDTVGYFGVTYFDEFIGTNSKDEPISIRDYIGFPIYFKGFLLGYSLRNAKQDKRTKWLHQPSHIQTGELLYNYDKVIGELKVAVVEGITDVWAYHEIGVPAVATYGAKISQSQKRLLLQLGCDLVFSFDGDDAGSEAMKKAYDLFNKTSNIQFVHLPNGKDPENIPREELKKYYEQKSYHYLPKDT